MEGFKCHFIFKIGNSWETMNRGKDIKGLRVMLIFSSLTAVQRNFHNDCINYIKSGKVSFILSQSRSLDPEDNPAAPCQGQLVGSSAFNFWSQLFLEDKTRILFHMHYEDEKYYLRAYFLYCALNIYTCARARVCVLIDRCTKRISPGVISKVNCKAIQQKLNNMKVFKRKSQLYFLATMPICVDLALALMAYIFSQPSFLGRSLVFMKIIREPSSGSWSPEVN